MGDILADYLPYSPMSVAGTLAFQELQQVLSELICILEESTVTGTVVHLQLALGNLAVHIVGVDAGHHHVGFTVDDEGGGQCTPYRPAAACPSDE